MSWEEEGVKGVVKGARKGNGGLTWSKCIVYMYEQVIRKSITKYITLQQAL